MSQGKLVMKCDYCDLPANVNECYALLTNPDYLAGKYGTAEKPVDVTVTATADGHRDTTGRTERGYSFIYDYKVSSRTLGPSFQRHNKSTLYPTFPTPTVKSRRIG